MITVRYDHDKQIYVLYVKFDDGTFIGKTLVKPDLIRLRNDIDRLLENDGDGKQA